MGAPTRSPLSQRQRGSKNRRRPRRLCLSTAVSGPLARGARRTAADPACLTQRRRLGRAENRAGSFDSARPEGPSPSAQDGRSGQLAPLRMTGGRISQTRSAQDDREKARGSNGGRSWHHCHPRAHVRPCSQRRPPSPRPLSPLPGARRTAACPTTGNAVPPNAASPSAAMQWPGAREACREPCRGKSRVPLTRRGRNVTILGVAATAENHPPNEPGQDDSVTAICNYQ